MNVQIAADDTELCSRHDLLLNKVCKDIELDQEAIDPDSETYKDLQYLLELIDLIRGATDLCGSGHEARAKDLAEVKHRINKLELMV